MVSLSLSSSNKMPMITKNWNFNSGSFRISLYSPLRGSGSVLHFETFGSMRFCILGYLGSQGSNGNFCNFSKVSYFWGCFFLVFQGHCGMFELHSWQKLYNIKLRKISILFHINTFLILNKVKLRFLHGSLKERVPL